MTITMTSIRATGTVVAMIGMTWLMPRAYGQQSPPSAPTTVVNTNANPIPVRAPSPLPVSGSVSIAGTPAVSIVGTPTVNAGNAPLPVSGRVSISNPALTVAGSVTANQGGAWSVGIAGIPTVNLANTTVVTRDADKPAKTRSAHSMSATGGSILVPSGKIAVIETVTARAIGSTGGFYVPTLTVTTEGNPLSHTIAHTTQEISPSSRYYVATHSIGIYADPGSSIVLGANLLTTTQLLGSVSISGHYVDALQ